MDKNVKQVTPLELKALIDSKAEFCLIDCREADEREICSINGELIPVSQIESNLNKIPKDKQTIIHCRSGGRSTKVVKFLQARYGYTNLYNLEGGILRWIDDVDPSLTKY